MSLLISTIYWIVLDNFPEIHHEDVNVGRVIAKYDPHLFLWTAKNEVSSVFLGSPNTGFLITTQHHQKPTMI